MKFQIKNRKKFIISTILISTFIIIVTIIFLVNYFNNSELRSINIYDNNGNKVKSNKLYNIEKYESYNNEGQNIVEMTQDPYFAEVETLLNVNNVDKLYSKMNKDFLQNNNLNENNFRNYLESNGYIGKFPSASSMTYCVQKNGDCIFRVKCFNDERRKYYVNLIEKKAFDYTIDFTQDYVPTTDEKVYNINSQNLNYEVTELYRKDSSIALQIKITNYSDKEVEFYFNSISDIELNLENKGKVRQATSELSSTKYIINKNSYIIKKLYFPLDMQYHSKIKGITFYNVRFEDSRKNIVINF